MKKIPFNDRFGLTGAVQEKRKTMTRRAERIDFFPGSREEDIEKFCYIATDAKGRRVWHGYDSKGNWIAQLVSRYAIGEEVAVAQSYKSIVEQDPDNDYGNYYVKQFRYAPGWTNKMFVRADLMPHRIRITNIRVERLQDISDEDCLKEGIYEDAEEHGGLYTTPFYDFLGNEEDGFYEPRAAFAALIDKVSGNGTWERNPWVFVYEFELVK